MPLKKLSLKAVAITYSVKSKAQSKKGVRNEI